MIKMLPQTQSARFILSFLFLMLALVVAAVLEYREAYEHNNANIFGMFFIVVPALYIFGTVMFFKMTDIRKQNAGFVMMLLPVPYVVCWALSILIRGVA